uniref:Tax1 (human T-cell leukemia virus type I) binding protein 1a n=1 Tax=Cyclopterus lumpus TaxID=8103 RepID=A0A8C3AIA8_CYCLU
MSSFQVVDSSPGSSVSIMETSNFAHVIFQNVGKSFMPQAPLECCYTLTPYITPNPKDWVGIFKVGWSTARDYYTFLWSPTSEHYEPGSTVDRTVVFQGYYVPKSDGEFYQFCYVSHVGDIRGASTPFQFRSATPTDELLTVTEDDSNSDILVHVEEAQQERRDLLKAMHLLHEEKQQLQEEQRRLAREREQERETCSLLRTHNQVRKTVQKVLISFSSLRDRLKKLTAERDSLESQLKNEKDERDLYKAHLRSTELENTKLSAELQMLKAVELNREVTIAQFQEELDRLRLCADLARVRELLRQAEEQLQASRQQASLLASELRDSASARDHTMTELYRARLEADKLRASLADAQAECQRMESQLDRMRSTAQTEVARALGILNMMVVSEAEAELQREVEELKLRLHMAAEHYKEKYRECQRLRRQVAKLNTTESQGEPKRNASTETTQEPLTPSPESPTAEMAVKAEEVRDVAERQVLLEVEGRRMGEAEKAQTRSVEKELAMMEEKWRQQCAINETLKQRLANEEERFRVHMAERASEVTELKRNLAQALRDKEQLQEVQREQETGVQGAEIRQPMVLRYPLPYPQDPSPPPLVPHRPAELQYGNPYSTDNTRDRADVSLSPEHMSRPPPEAPPCAPPCVVCIQPSRTTSPPESLEHPAEEPRNVSAYKHKYGMESHTRNPGCVHKRCPLCEVIFPPHFEQRSFEQHVESHWKVCPVCSEQFPLNCQQQLFERHVLTHFDGHVLNFEQIE